MSARTYNRSKQWFFQVNNAVLSSDVQKHFGFSISRNENREQVVVRHKKKPIRRYHQTMIKTHLQYFFLHFFTFGLQLLFDKRKLHLFRITINIVPWTWFYFFCYHHKILVPGSLSYVIMFYLQNWSHLFKTFSKKVQHSFETTKTSFIEAKSSLAWPQICNPANDLDHHSNPNI